MEADTSTPRLDFESEVTMSATTRLGKHTSSGGHGSLDAPKTRKALLTKIKDSCLLAQGLCWAGFFFTCVMLVMYAAGTVQYFTGVSDSMAIPNSTILVTAEDPLTLYAEDGPAANFYGEAAQTLRNNGYEDNQTVPIDELEIITRLARYSEQWDPGIWERPERSRYELLFVWQENQLPILRFVSYFVETPLLLAMLWIGSRFFGRAARQEGPLRPERAFELKLVGMLLIAYSFVPDLVAVLVQGLGPSTLGGGSHGIGQIMPFALGVFMLAFARVFKYGSMLQQQDDELV